MSNSSRLKEGTKYDGGKPRYDLLTPESLDGVSSILGFGAAKYEDRNWEKGINFGRVFASCMRHLWAWWGGEELDSESGLHHLDHAACNIMFLKTYVARGMKEYDDRPGMV